jgi:hypothetical protein
MLQRYFETVSRAKTAIKEFRSATFGALKREMLAQDFRRLLRDGQLDEVLVQVCTDSWKAGALSELLFNGGYVSTDAAELLAKLHREGVDISAAEADIKMALRIRGLSPFMKRLLEFALDIPSEEPPSEEPPREYA